AQYALDLLTRARSSVGAKTIRRGQGVDHRPNVPRSVWARLLQGDPLQHLVNEAAKVSPACRSNWRYGLGASLIGASRRLDRHVRPLGGVLHELAPRALPARGQRVAAFGA